MVADTLERGTGHVIASHGRSFLIGIGPGESLVAVTRGKRGDCVVGDTVEWLRTSADQAVIEQVGVRRNLVRRSDRYKTKSIAANVDQALAVVSGEPLFDEALLLRVAIAMGAQQVPLHIVATKMDLSASLAALRPRLDVLRGLGYPVHEIALKNRIQGLDALRAATADRCTLLLGQSGMGKSTLVNALVPGAEQQTAAISSALNSGRHTTTFTRAFPLPDGPGLVIDSPGFQTFEISHLSVWEKAHAMPEFAPYLGQCRFNDCRHRDEPGCAIRAALAGGRIDPLRYRLYTELAED
jgi:ribosome biogenesis GTPase / thiamine phosphate phosphatase